MGISYDKFTAAYVECAIWSSTIDDPAYPSDENNPGGVPMDSRYSESDLADETRQKIIADCQRFQAFVIELKIDLEESYDGDCTCSCEEYAGHDFWLTRNGHGAGFWDGDWNEPDATQLTKLSAQFGMCDLYVGDDGKLYLEGGKDV